MDLTARLINLARRWRRSPPARFTRVIDVASRDLLPTRLHPRRVYVIGSPAKWAVLDCPCGHGHQIQLNLAHTDRVQWSLHLTDRGHPSLAPSVDVRASRRCHFWLRNGIVDWT